MIWLAIGLGGALGAMARHGLNAVVHQRLLGVRFPLGIFIINIVGSLAIGALGGYLASGRLTLGYHARAFLIVGVLGGFTTFSSFSFDTLALTREGFVLQAWCNAIGQVVLSLIAVWLGFSVGVARG